MDKAGYRIAVDSTEDISYIENNEDLPLADKVNTSNTIDRLLRNGNDNMMNVYDEAEAKHEAETDERIDLNTSWETPTESQR